MILKDFTIYLITFQVLYILTILFIYSVFLFLNNLLLLLIKEIFKNYIETINQICASSFY